MSLPDQQNDSIQGQSDDSILDKDGTPKRFLLTEVLIIEKQSPLYKNLTFVNNVALITSTLLLFVILGFVVAYSVIVLNNMEALTVIQSQSVPGSPEPLPTN